MFLKLPNLHVLIKQKSPSLSRNLALKTFGKFAKNFLGKGKPAMPHLFNDPEVLPFAPDIEKLFAKNFSKNYNIEDSVIPLAAFPFGSNLKMHNISVNLQDAGFYLTTRNSYFTILVDVFTNHIPAENIYFTNHIE